MRKYLVEDRALPAPYIDKLHQQGDCYADARRNAVFIAGTLKAAPSAGLKGTIQRSDGSRFSGMTRIGQGRRRIPYRQHRQGRGDLPCGIGH